MSKTFIKLLIEKSEARRKRIPPKKKVVDFVDTLMVFLFRTDLPKDEKKLMAEWQDMNQSLKEILETIEMKGRDTQKIAEGFFRDIPAVYELLLKDIEAFVSFDPASTCEEEVIAAYPGFFAIAVYRFANLLYKAHVPILPRIMTEYAHGQTGVDINPGATIGESFFIDHGTGIVIGETTMIGHNVKLYQGVTLGALSVKKSLAKRKRHPTVEDEVTIYANATILGGTTIIGKGAVIGGNTFITKSVKPFTTVIPKVGSHSVMVNVNETKKININEL